MKIYEFRFSYDKRVPYSLIEILEEMRYEILEWENGKLVIASDRKSATIFELGKLIAVYINYRVLMFSWPVHLTVIDEEENLNESEIKERAHELL